MDKTAQEIIDGISDKTQQTDCKWLFDVLKDITKQPVRIWGKQMLGFGTYTYSLSNGKKGEWFMSGFSPRSKNISIYMLAGFEGELQPYLKTLGKHTLGKGCLYIKKLEDVNTEVLKQMMVLSYKIMEEKYKGTRGL